MIAPTVKRMAGTSMTDFLPNRSANNPVEGAEIKASSEVMAVTRALSGVVRGRFDKSDPMDTRVLEMTPVSNPNKRPLIPAERVRNRMTGLASWKDIWVGMLGSASSRESNGLSRAIKGWFASGSPSSRRILSSSYVSSSVLLGIWRSIGVGIRRDAVRLPRVIAR